MNESSTGSEPLAMMVFFVFQTVFCPLSPSTSMVLASVKRP